MKRINESIPISQTEVVYPLFVKDPDTPEDLDLPRVRWLRFIARSLMAAAQKRKERMIAAYKEQLARRQARKTGP